jgi:hypothetical protein
LKGPNQEFEVMWNQVQIFKKGKKLKKFDIKKAFTTFTASSLPTKYIP